MEDLVLSPNLEALLSKIDLLQDKPIKLWSTVTEILGFVKILELQQDTGVAASSRLWLEKVRKAVQHANHLLDPANLTALSNENVAERDSVMRGLWSRFDCLFQERKGLPEIQPQAFNFHELLMLFGSREVVGRESQIDFMCSWIIREDAKSELQHLSTLAICGEEGIGKTSLVRFVFNDEKVMKYFRVRAWASATCDEVDLVSIAREIVASVSGFFCPLNDPAELDNVVRDTLQSSRALIVLDNFQRMEESNWLHMLRYWFCVLDSGSKVILTTSRNKVARMADSQLELGRLSHDASWSLFSSLAFDSSKFDDIDQRIADNANYLVRARTIAARCLGNPLVLRIWGNLLRFRSDDTENLLAKHVDYRKDVNSMLHLSYVCLPEPMRQCLVFCALFPRGYTLHKDWLIQMWIAHGLILPVQEVRSLERTAVAYFQQLLPFFIDLNWDENGDITECRLPGLIHQLLEDVAGIASGKEGGLVSRINKNGRQTSLEFVSESQTIQLPVNFDAEHLRTLLVSGKFIGNLSSSISKFKCVSVLDLSSTGILELTSRIDTLTQLKYLDLSHTLIKRIPDTITNILALQTLKLSCCHNLQTLPRRMHSLINLRYLEMELCDSLLYLPSGIGKLIYLQSMSSFVLGQEDKCARLSELQSLKHLKGKLAIENLENVRSPREAKGAKLHKKSGLEHLKFSWGAGSSKMSSNSLLECLVPHSNLKSLDIQGYMSGEFPSWLQKVSSLTKVSIHDCGCVVLPPLGLLPNLKVLLIEGMFKLETIGKEFYGDDYFSSGFDSLECLEFRDMPLLLDWTSAPPRQETCSSSTKQAFLRLKSLTIEGCPKLIGLPHLPAVENMVISNSNSKILSSLPDLPSLSSVLIKEILMDSFETALSSIPVDKLIIYDCFGDLNHVLEHGTMKFTSLTHLGLFKCHDLSYLSAECLNSLLKLDIVDCCDLRNFKDMGPLSSLKELILDSCPALESLPNGSHFTSLEKLIIKGCTELSSLPEKDEMLAQLKYLSISGCPMLEKKLQRDTGEEWFKISHIPRTIIDSNYLLRD